MTPGGAGEKDDRSDIVFRQPALDLPYELPALLEVGLHRLAIDQTIELRIAIPAVVALRAASKILVKLLVGIVEPVLADHHTNGKVLAQHLGIPGGGVDC